MSQEGIQLQDIHIYEPKSSASLLSGLVQQKHVQTEQDLLQENEHLSAFILETARKANEHSPVLTEEEQGKFNQAIDIINNYYINKAAKYGISANHIVSTEIIPAKHNSLYYRARK